jgi:hypothetical protein
MGLKGHFLNIAMAIPGNKFLFSVFLFLMFLLVPFIRYLDLWQVLVAFILLVSYSITKKKFFGISTVWFMTAVVLHNVWMFIFIILKLQFGIDLLP